jgi:hypothetical protein
METGYTQMVELQLYGIPRKEKLWILKNISDLRKLKERKE